LLLKKGRLSDNRICPEDALDCFEKAEEVFNAKTDRSDADLLRVRISLGQTLVELDRFEDAEAAFDRAMAVERQPPYEARAHKASLLINIAKYQPAADLLKATIALFPDRNDEGVKARLSWLHLARGCALRCTGRATFHDVEQLLRTAVEFLPDDPFSKAYLASLLKHSEEQNFREEGENLLASLTGSATAQALPLAMLGWCHFLRRRYEAAEHWLRAALPTASSNKAPDEEKVSDDKKVSDDDIETRFNLALVLLNVRPAEGREEYTTAMTQAQARPASRRRGLLHVAILDLIEAARDRDNVIRREDGESVWKHLRNALDEPNYSSEELAVPEL
jgi:tetratricopeptide (TPR) repeat protein